ncbi:hypothetical protein SELMODRAFT_447965 [Selaginella moellendorffii]|uniref:HECT-type E3 ubiquitin transferase n=1 Tax=Selaginella moellendorffii TaxID=88036 RepID=D8T3T3_SELML|nr:ubiquitin-protein ligase E3A isoform X1 [Selaginella moellendorffii]EFJ08655.1 hypothetical protein SELMODRAFT_447965 [Selaginella moellendorffii]|eukprot:XP_002990240.1 ubiquitin-protein ligase E3A isoform X1 [Selaginella moellendorffii]
MEDASTTSSSSSKENVRLDVMKYFDEFRERGMLANEAAALALKVAYGNVDPPLDPASLLDAIAKAGETRQYRELIETIKFAFSSVDVVSTCFLSKTPPNSDSSSSLVAGMELSLLEDFYVSALRLEAPEVNLAIMEANEQLLASLLRSLKDGSWPSGSLRAVIIMLENRLFMEPDYYGTLSRLWRLVLDAPQSFRASLFSALKEYDGKQLERLVVVIQQFITIQLYEFQQVNTMVVSGVEILGFIYSVNESSLRIGHSAFYNDAVNNDDFNLKDDFSRWVDPTRQQFSFCQYPFVFDPSSKSKILQMDSIFQMTEEFEDAILRSVFIGMTCPYLILRVRRDFLVRDTIVQIQEQLGDLKKPLKVVFVGEEGIDEGGVQKEFFQLLVRELFNPQYGMFSYSDEARCFWFNATPSELNFDTEFELVGILLGLAIYNGHILDLHFPTVVYKKLLGKPLALDDLGQVKPDLAKGLEHLLRFTGDVEETYSRTFQISEIDMFGRTATVNLKEGGENIDLNLQNRDEYVKLCVEYYLGKSIARQFECFSQGFRRLCKGRVLDLFQPVELEQLICGSPGLDFEALEKVAMYDDGYTKESRIIREFWEVVHSFTEEQKRKLLFFTTGSDRAPIKGLSNLQFVISRNGPDCERLPTAHTCFNHLLLPEYKTKEKLQERLLTAINNAEGFGLM